MKFSVDRLADQGSAKRLAEPARSVALGAARFLVNSASRSATGAPFRAPDRQGRAARRVFEIDIVGRQVAAFKIFQSTPTARIAEVIAQADRDIAERLRMLCARHRVSLP
jgi:hypothetical protein